MNDPFAITQSRIAADRLLGEFVANDEQRIIEAYRRTLGRFPTQKEVEIVQEHLLDASPNDLLGRQQLWAMVFQSLFSSAEFRYLK